MFQSFRNQKRWLMLLAMILIIPAFVFIGINGYSRLNPDANAIAKVDGKGIQPEEFDGQKREFIERERNRQGGQIDTSLFDTAEANSAILQQIASRRALLAQMSHHYVQVSDADAINVIKNADAFKKDGQFSPELYENYLAARGKSDQQFVQELRRDLVMDMLTNSVAQTVFVPKKSAAILNDILREERTVRTISFDPASYMSQVKITDEEMQKYYDSHKDQFHALEMLNIEFVVMSPQTIKVTAQPSEDELKAYYEQNKARFGVPESRRASHILISSDSAEKDAAKADADAKAKAEEIYKEAKADPSKFAELARTNSSDVGSAQNGGDLDYFGKDQMVPEFEKAVFEAKKGDILPPVKTEFGYHIIHVTDVIPAAIKSFAEVRPELVTLWQNQQRQQLFAENADNFTNMVYEQSDSLEPVVEKFGLKIHKLNDLTANGLPPSSEDAAYITKRVVEDLFSPDSLQEKRNTQAVEVAANTLVSARVVQHSPAHLKTFAEVKEEIKSELEHQKASELAKKAGEEKLAQLRAKKDLEGFGHTQVVSRVNPQSQSETLVQAELSVPAKVLPAFTGVQVPDGSYVISYVESSKMPKNDDSQAGQIHQSALHAQSMAEEQAYYDALKRLYKFEILKKEFDYQPQRAMN